MGKFNYIFSDIKHIFYYIFDLVLMVLAFLVKILSIRRAFRIPIDNSKKTTIIICNGPSLLDHINWIYKNSENLDISVVHYFAISEHFNKIKPRYYFFADPMFWRDDISREFQEDQENLFKKFDTVNWEMTIVCPLKGLKRIKKRINNKFIKFETIRHWSIEYKSEIISILSLRLNLTTPFFCTVAVMALWHAILRKRKNIYLFGFDFSSFKEYKVDQKTNELINEFSHFYENQKSEKVPHSKYDKKPKLLLNTLLYKIWLSFEQMYLLSVLAKFKKINIYNCSSNSYLDCFKRNNLTTNKK